MSLLSGTGKLWAGTTIDCNFSPPCTGTSSSYLACGVADSISSERSVMNLYLIPFADNSDLIRSWSKVSHSDWLCDFGWSYNLLFSLLAALKVFALSDHTVWQTPLRFVMRLKACRNSSVVWPFVSSKWPIRDDAFVDDAYVRFRDTWLSFTYKGPTKSVPIYTNSKLAIFAVEFPLS